MKFNSFFLKKSPTVFKLLILLCLTGSLSGCDPVGDQIEAIVQPNVDDFSVLYTDSTTVALSTIGTDSVMTGAPSRLLVGKYNDPYFGKFQSAAYFQPTIESGLVYPDLAVYDSLTLSLRYDGYSHGDTTVAMNISVHQSLADLLDRRVYYNDYVTPYDPTPLGRVKLLPSPRNNGTVKVKLSDKLGKQIFELAKSNQITSNTEWINVLKGLALIPGNNDNGPVVGFALVNDATALQIHYHTIEVDGVKKDSTIIRTNIAYNQILGDRTGTQLTKLPVNNRMSLPSEQSGNMSFIQAGLGVMTRIDLPTVLDFKANPYTVINRAYLRVTPLKASVTNFLNPPAELFAYLVDRNNEFYVDQRGYPAALTELSTGAPVTGRYTVDLLNNTTYYLFDLRGYLTTIMLSETNTAGIVLRTSTFNTESATSNTTYPAANSEFTKSASRLVIGNQQNSDPGVKLEVYYTSVQNR